jgi:DEAD/DEAH box helicase domain-containing protein
VLVASSDPLDQYLVRHPEFFREATPEHARIAPDQALILLDHIRCAAFELPFAGAAKFGQIDATPWLEFLAEDGVLYREGERWEWVADSYPAGAVSLRSVADGNFVVVDRTAGKQAIVAEVDYSAAAVTLYEGAIHMIQAVPYQVERLDWEGRKAFVTRTHVDYYTDAIDYTKLKVLDCFASAGAGGGLAAHGEVHVVRRVAGYKKIRYYSHENIGYGPVNLPDQELHTTAVWWQLPQAALDAAFADRQQALDGFLGAACALHLVATVAVMAEQRDLQKSVGSGDGAWFVSADQRGRGQLRGVDGEATALAPGAPFTPTVYLYDAFPGGVGLSAPLYARREELLTHALALVEACDCRSGCPACVGPILAADEDAQRTPKALAARVLAMLIGP